MRCLPAKSISNSKRADALRRNRGRGRNDAYRLPHASFWNRKKPLWYFTRNGRENKRAEMGTSVGVWFWGMLAAVILLGLSDTGRSDDTSGEETKSETTTEEQTEEGGWMCAVGFVEEEELYIDEWLAYHQILGFDYFFLCDGGNNASLGEFLRTHAEAGYVAVVPWPHSTADNHVGGCLKLALDIMHAKKHDQLKKCSWVSFFGASEFFSFRARNGKGAIKQHMATLPQGTEEVSVLKYHFGHNDHYDDPPLDSLVITSFIRRENPSDSAGRRTKSIFRVSALPSGHILFASHPEFDEPPEPHFGLKPHLTPEHELVVHHYKTRSFLHHMHRIIRDTHVGPDVHFRNFVLQSVNLNEVEDLSLVSYKDDVIANLDGLKLWKNRNERLQPYALNISLRIPIHT